MAGQNSEILLNFKPKRDAYGFTVRPQYIHRYREYANIYKEEEGERVQKWKSFLEQQAESTRADPCEDDDITLEVSEVTDQSSVLAETASREVSEVTKQSSDLAETASGERDDSTEQCLGDSEVTAKETKPCEEVKTWAEISPYLNCIERMMSARVKKRKNMKSETTRCMRENFPSIDEERLSGEESEDDDKDVSHDDERIDGANASAVERSVSDNMSSETFFPWKEELESLVQGGVPKDLRGEVWQAFVGVRTRRVESYYQELLADEFDASDGMEHDESSCEEHKTEHDESSCEEHKTEHDESSSEEHKMQLKKKKYELPEKLKKQIEKDLPRTFPGHPALNENGRNSLRRVLFAYARHNPSVGYCQAMNFFAGLLLLMMPEENAFWTLVGIMDDYFEGYFSQEMIESQVDQLIFEDLMREKFPKLMHHLDYLGVDVSWISGTWFLSIFVNMLPWESVLRVWDVILFEGNRVMVFRTALTLMDLYGPTVVTTKDTGDAIVLLQTLAGSTFDSSQLVLTACMGFLTVTEDQLNELREKHRPAVVAAIEDRAKGVQFSKDPKGLATKLYSFKHGSIVKENKTDAGSDDKLDSHSANLDEIFKGINIDSEVDSLPDLQEQIVWLKVELCRLLEEKRSAMLRAEELEAAFMEMVKEDNRRELSARVEQLEKEVAELRQALDDKKQAENAMLQVLLKVEQEQRVTEDARLFAEQQVATQKHAVHVLQEKYENAMISLTQMEKRAVMAESMLEATLQYESGQNKALLSPGPGYLESPRDMPVKRSGLLSFGLGWRDRNKSTLENKPNTSDTAAENKSDTGVADTNGHHE